MLRPHSHRGERMRRLMGLAAVVAGLAILPDTVLALEGRVVEAGTDRPLANVTVSIVGRGQTARSDAEGRFVLVPDPQPPFEVLAVLPGGGYVKPIQIDALPAQGPL